MRMRRVACLTLGAAVLLLASWGVLARGQERKDMYIGKNGLQYVAKTDNQEYYFYEDGEWNPVFLTGVNMGATVPGNFPGELAIPYETYMRWFGQIADMHAKVVRVYTIMPPVFYEALHDFNQEREAPLFLMQGIYLDETQIAELGDAFAQEALIQRYFKRQVRDAIDVMHGNKEIAPEPGLAHGSFRHDVSAYVAGWILGVEWDPLFVQKTDENNPERREFTGDYLYTQGASPFEVFLAEVGEEALAYEAEAYAMTRPLSFVNWPTTDLLEHPNEPDYREDLVTVNTEHIRATAKAESGLFAAYHIYPYYPDFLNFDEKYAVPDASGNIDTYRAYLRELIQRHTVPVLVAEYGVPSSRAKAHDARYSGYNQGAHSEQEQGEIVEDLTWKIREEGYSGALVFTWQDEWFKRSWNTMEYDDPDRRPYWFNVQTNEQQFGLLAMEPGETRSLSYPDGDLEEWGEEHVRYRDSELTLSAQSDEAFLYLMVDAEYFTYGKDRLYLPIDTVLDQGSTAVDGLPLQFSDPADFLVEIVDDAESRIRVHAYYDVFYFQYAETLALLPQEPAHAHPETNLFRPMELALSKELYLPETQKTIPFAKYETGLLRHGNGNPAAADYTSLADFSIQGSVIELAIPWQLLNIMDPSNKLQMANLYEPGSIHSQPFEEICMGAAILRQGESREKEVLLVPYTWDNWELPTYHERLKQSYYVMQRVFAELERRDIQ